jgi:twitching motility two-component system response regulator PilH
MKRILIVDDSTTDRVSLRKILTGGGYDVLEAADAEQGITLAKSEQPDAILMDIVMPGKNGFEATRSLSRDPQTQHIPIIMVSSKTERPDTARASMNGARAYIFKPARSADVLARLAGVGCKS